jgi:hypothetical protein
VAKYCPAIARYSTIAVPKIDLPPFAETAATRWLTDRQAAPIAVLLLKVKK